MDLLSVLGQSAMDFTFPALGGADLDAGCARCVCATKAVPCTGSSCIDSSGTTCENSSTCSDTSCTSGSNGGSCGGAICATSL
jgi:hypothetical protein